MHQYCCRMFTPKLNRTLTICTSGSSLRFIFKIFRNKRFSCILKTVFNFCVFELQFYIKRMYSNREFVLVILNKF